MKKKILTTAICTVLAVLLFGCGGMTAEKALDAAHGYTGVDASLTEVISTSENITDAAGNEIVVVDFVNDGTEYICKVDANSSKVISVSKENNELSANNAYTLSQAKEAALKDAGVSADTVVFTKAKSEYDDGEVRYEVEFITGGREFEYEINANTLGIISVDIDRENSVTKPQDSITEDSAKQIALEHAGLKAENVTFTKVRFDEDDGVYFYDLEFVNGGAEYEYELHAVTGAIINMDTDRDGTFNTNSNTGENTSAPPANNTNRPGKDSASDKGNASSQQTTNLISKEKAESIALTDAGFEAKDVIMEVSGLDYDDGIAKYEIDFYADGYDYDYDINAKTGEIIGRSKEKDDDYVKRPSSSEKQDNASAKQENNSSKTETNTITLEKAKEIALNNAGLSESDVRFSTAKKDRDDGVSYYEIEFYSGRTEYSYDISMTGKIIEKDVDRD